MTLRVKIDSRYPLSITASPEDIGAIFACASSDAQIAILRAMLEAMEAHPIQWDYIAIDLDEPENRTLRGKINQTFRYITEVQP